MTDTERVPRWGLQARLVVLLASVLSVSIALISGYFIVRQRQQLDAAAADQARRARTHLVKRGMALARNVALSSERAIAVLDFLFLTEILHGAVGGDEELMYAVLMDRERRALVHSDPERAHQVLEDSGARHAHAQVEPGVFERSDLNVLEVFAPVHVGDERWGTVSFGWSLGRVNEDIARSKMEAADKVRSAVLATLVAAFVLIAVFSALGVLLAERVVRPLKEMVGAVRSVASGHLSQRVEARGSAEFIELASVFNGMTQRLESLLLEMTDRSSMERELASARSIQTRMSPPSGVLDLGDYLLTGECRMAEACGGDWWSYRQLVDGRLLLVVGDVTGHGLPAAMVASTARGALEALSVMDGPSITPSAVLQAVDGAVRDVGREEYFMTCFASILDRAAGRIDFANAGHPMPLLSRGDTGDLDVLVARGNPLGMRGPRIGVGSAELRPGDIIVYATDGLDEARNRKGQMFGVRRVCDQLTAHRALKKPTGADLAGRLFRAVNAHAGGHPQEDDITIVVCEAKDWATQTGATCEASSAGASGGGLSRSTPERR